MSGVQKVVVIKNKIDTKMVSSTGESTLDIVEMEGLEKKIDTKNSGNELS